MNSIIDIHTHYTTPYYVDSLASHGRMKEDGFPMPEWSPEAHLSFMDCVGIEKSILTISSPHQYSGDIAECRDLTKRLNNDGAELKQKYPTRFGFMAVLPLPDIEASVETVKEAFDELGADGIKFPTNALGLYMGDPSMKPIFEELNKRNAVVTMHPCRPQPINDNVFSAGPIPFYEFLADTTRAVLNLIGNGFLEKYPNVKIIVPHCGSFIPTIYPRWISLVPALVEKGAMEPIDMKGNFDKLYYDIAGNPAELLPSLMAITTPDKIMYGSDFPFTPGKGCKVRLEQLLEALDKNDTLSPYKEDFLYGNAKKLFNL